MDRVERVNVVLTGAIRRLDSFLLRQPPPAPPAGDDPDGLNLLRYLWFAREGSSKELAAALGISAPHLIRLLRGDRGASRPVRERIGVVARLLSGSDPQRGGPEAGESW